MDDIFKLVDEALRELEEQESKSKSNDLEEFLKELDEEFRK